MGNGTWTKAKEIRINILGCFCELSDHGSEKRKIIGHHIYNHSNGKQWKTDVWWMCQLRCRTCEGYYHAKYQNGNSRKSNNISKRNNEIILKSLESNGKNYKGGDTRRIKLILPEKKINHYFLELMGLCDKYRGKQEFKVLSSHLKSKHDSYIVFYLKGDSQIINDFIKENEALEAVIEPDS